MLKRLLHHLIEKKITFKYKKISQKGIFQQQYGFLFLEIGLDSKKSLTNNKRVVLNNL